MSAVRFLVLASAVLGTVFAQRVGAPTDDLDNLSVDELFTLQVTSVGRKAQELSKAPTAVFVLTAEDIKRSGSTCIPEALQWVPGLTVFHLDGRTWGVSARGSGRVYADKILVMIDGRSLYTPLFSGVIWDAIDVPLEGIERIEAVRGPGAVMWGPNAVNGVIDISPAVVYEWDHFPSDLRHQALLRSQFDLSGHLQLDLMARVRSRDLAYEIPGSFFADVRLGWRPTRGAELSAVVRNLTIRHVIDCTSEGTNPAIPLRRTFVLEWRQRI